MKTFKITLRIVFATALVLNILVAITNVFLGFGTVIGMLLFWINLIDYPITLAFILVILYQWLFKRTPVSFFKTELIYLGVKIGAIVLFALSYNICPACPG
jgi:hypothetical protein